MRPKDMTIEERIVEAIHYMAKYRSKRLASLSIKTYRYKDLERSLGSKCRYQAHAYSPGIVIQGNYGPTVIIRKL